MLKLITDDLLDRLTAQAADQPRRRSHHNIHESFDDPVQKLLVAATRDSYFRPHRHPDKREFALVLRGQFEIILFDDSGGVSARQRIGDNTGVNGFEIPAATWHCWLVKSDNGIFFEAKQGPYDPKTAAEFAPWAPAEGGSEVQAYLAGLHAGE